MMAVAVLALAGATAGQASCARATAQGLATNVPSSGRIAGLGVDRMGRAVIALPTTYKAKPWIVRLTADGNLDPSFAEAGILQPAIEGTGVQVAVRGDGSVLVAGMRRYETVLRRFKASGKLDRSFGKKGAIHLRGIAIERLMMQPGGSIVLLGTTTCPPSSCGYLYRNLQAIRLTASGRPIRHLNISHESWNFDAAGIGPDGSFAVAGDDWELEYQTFDGFLPSGRFDLKFGHKTFSFDNEPISGVADIAVQSGGGFVLATGQGLWRRNHNGAPDRTFGEAGHVICGAAPDPESFMVAPFGFVVASADGKLIAAGGKGECGLVRYLGDGSPDTTFAGDGTVDLGPTGIDPPKALASLSDGRIILAGWDNASGSLRLARYTTDGALDAGFGSGGIATPALLPPG